MLVNLSSIAIEVDFFEHIVMNCVLLNKCQCSVLKHISVCNNLLITA